MNEVPGRDEDVPNVKNAQNAGELISSEMEILFEAV